jgi:hypothetical protein
MRPLCVVGFTRVRTPESPAAFYPWCVLNASISYRSIHCWPILTLSDNASPGYIYLWGLFKKTALFCARCLLAFAQARCRQSGGRVGGQGCSATEFTSRDLDD